MVEQTQSVPDKDIPLHRKFSFREIGKRLFDITVSCLGLFFLSPIFGLLAIRIKRGSPGPIFYQGRRAARRGGEFKILKFRTMYEDERSYNGPKVTGEGDPRVTPVGKWLRDTKLNELPQLWNVLKGDMSLVGPRPEDPEIASEWPEDIRQEILSVRPGISSPASVMYRDEEQMLEGERLMETYLQSIAPNKLRLDQLYVRYHNFLLDLDVLLWTFLILIPRVRGYQPPENQIYLGPFSIFARRYVSWFLIDTLTVFAAFGVTGLLWRSLQTLNIGWTKSIVFALGFALVFSLISVFSDLNRIDWKRADAGDAFYVLPPVIVATLVVLGINWILGVLPAFPNWDLAIKEVLRSFGIVWGLELFPNSLIMIASLLATIGFIMVRYRSRLITGLLSRLLSSQNIQAASERVLVVGGGQAGQFAIWWLSNSEESKLFHTVGIVDDDLYKQGARIRGVNVVGQSKDIPKLVQTLDVGIIIFAIHKISEQEKEDLLLICQQTTAQIVVLPDLLEALNQARMENSYQEKNTVEGETTWRIDGVPTSLIYEWLDQIDILAASGDNEGLQQSIAEMRKKISKDH